MDERFDMELDQVELLSMAAAKAQIKSGPVHEGSEKCGPGHDPIQLCEKRVSFTHTALFDRAQSDFKSWITELAPTCVAHCSGHGRTLVRNL